MVTVGVWARQHPEYGLRLSASVKLLGLCLRPDLALTLLVLCDGPAATAQPRPGVSGASRSCMATECSRYALVMFELLRVSTLLSWSLGVGPLALAFDTSAHGV